MKAATVVPFVDLRAQYRQIAGEVDAAIRGVLERCDFILGSAVSDLEARFAGFVEARHAVGMSNGLDALRLALLAAGVRAGDEVIVPANTFVATALAVSGVGAHPVLVDCDRRTFNLDVAQIEDAVTPRTRAIMPVHLAGQAADMDPILEIGRRRDLMVVEDAAQAQGTKYRGRRCGSLGLAAGFSFYPAKNLGAYGDAGMVTTSDERLAERLRRLGNYGQAAKYEHVEQGLNARLDTLQAAVLDVKLRHLEGWNAARARHAARYRALLAGVGDVVTPEEAGYSTHIYHLFMVETGRRDALRAHLAARGIETGIHYPTPIHLQAAYRELGHHAGDFPRTEALAERLLSLPMYPELADWQIERVAEETRAFFAAAPAARAS